MTAFVNILFGLHLLGLAMGLGGGIANSNVGPLLGKASGETRPVLWHIIHAITRVSIVGLVLLLITGPLMLWLGFGWKAPDMAAFWVKMAFVVALIVSIAITDMSALKAEKGDMAAAKRMKTFGMLNGIFALGVIFAACFAFS